MTRCQRIAVFGTAALALLTWSSGLSAQDKSTYYTVRNPGEFQINWKAFYDKADELTGQARRLLAHELDIPYGPAAKQKLDLYLPTDRPSGAAVLIFLHGGGFREGDRAHYGYVAVPFARQGVITVVPSYRLTPEGRFPDQPEDVRAVLRWVAANVGTRGGDPQRLYLAGHSAGAILTATVCTDPRWREGVGPLRLRGCVSISGSYDLRGLGGVPGYVADPAQAEAASPVANARPGSPPMIVAFGSLEERYSEPSRKLMEAIRASGGRAELLVLENQAHDDTAATLADGTGALVRAISALMAETGQ